MCLIRAIYTYLYQLMSAKVNIKHAHISDVLELRQFVAAFMGNEECHVAFEDGSANY